jgi:hypothetical protein
MTILKESSMSATTPGPRDLMKSMHAYFQDKKVEALVFILPIGILALIVSIRMLTDTPALSLAASRFPCFCWVS